jgi:hypothetical protein
MPKYRVSLTKHYIQATEVEVDAADEAEAKEKAWQVAEDPSTEWETMENDVNNDAFAQEDAP